MFGYIKPCIPELKVKEHELYKAVYCGLCKCQRRYTGKTSALLLSYDFVFLYLLRAEILGQHTAFKVRKASLIHPNMQNVALENKELLFCAAAAALLDHYKVKDDLSDEGFIKRLRARLILPFTAHNLRKAKKKALLPEKELKELLEMQSALEKENLSSPDRAAEISGEIFGLFASQGIDDELLRFAAHKIGKAVGCWLYLIDAADDLEEDKKKGRFNPFTKDAYRRNELLYTLDNHCESAELTLRQLQSFDPGYRALLINILTLGLHKEAEKIIFKEKNQDG